MELANTSSLIHPDIAQAWGSGETHLSPSSTNASSPYLENSGSASNAHREGMQQNEDHRQREESCSLLKQQQQQQAPQKGRRRVKQGSVIKLNFGKLQKYINDQHNEPCVAAAIQHDSPFIKSQLQLSKDQRARHQKTAAKVLQLWWKALVRLRERKYIMFGVWTKRTADCVFALVLGYRVRKLIKSAYIQELIVAQRDIIKVLFDLMRLEEERQIEYQYQALSDADQTLVNSLVKELAASKLSFHSAMFDGRHWVWHPAPGYWDLGSAVRARYQHLLKPPKHSKMRARSGSLAGARSGTTPTRISINNNSSSNNNNDNSTPPSSATPPRVFQPPYARSPGSAEHFPPPTSGAGRKGVGGISRPLFSASPDALSRNSARDKSNSGEIGVGGSSSGIVSHSAPTLAPSMNKKLKQKFASIGPPAASSSQLHNSSSSKNIGATTTESRDRGVPSSMIGMVLVSERKRSSVKPHIQLDVLSGDKLCAARKVLSRDTMELERVSDRIPCIRVSLWMPPFSSEGYSTSTLTSSSSSSSSSSFSSPDCGNSFDTSSSSSTSTSALKRVHQAKKDFRSTSLSPQWNSSFCIPLPCPKSAIQAIANHTHARLVGRKGGGSISSSSSVEGGEDSSNSSSFGVAIRAAVNSGLLTWWSKGKVCVEIYDGERFSEELDMGHVDILLSSFLLQALRHHGGSGRGGGSTSNNTSYSHRDHHQQQQQQQGMELKGTFQLEKAKSTDRVSGSIKLHAYLHLPEQSFIDEALEFGSAADSLSAATSAVQTFGGGSNGDSISSISSSSTSIRASLGNKLFIKTRQKQSPPTLSGARKGPESIAENVNNNLIISNNQRTQQENAPRLLESCEEEEEEEEEDREYVEDELLVVDNSHSAPNSKSYDDDDAVDATWMLRQKEHQQHQRHDDMKDNQYRHTYKLEESFLHLNENEDECLHDSKTAAGSSNGAVSTAAAATEDDDDDDRNRSSLGGGGGRPHSNSNAFRAKAARRASIVDITRQLVGLSHDVQVSTDDVFEHLNKKLSAAKEGKDKDKDSKLALASSSAKPPLVSSSSSSLSTAATATTATVAVSSKQPLLEQQPQQPTSVRVVKYPNLNLSDKSDVLPPAPAVPAGASYYNPSYTIMKNDGGALAAPTEHFGEDTVDIIFPRTHVKHDENDTAAASGAAVPIVVTGDCPKSPSRQRLDLLDSPVSTTTRSGRSRSPGGEGHSPIVSAAVDAVNAAVIPILMPQKFIFSKRRAPPPVPLSDSTTVNAAVVGNNDNSAGSSSSNNFASTDTATTTSKSRSYEQYMAKMRERRKMHSQQQQSVEGTDVEPSYSASRNSSYSTTTSSSSNAFVHKDRDVINRSVEGQSAFRAKLATFLDKRREARKNRASATTTEDADVASVNSTGNSAKSGHAGREEESGREECYTTTTTTNSMAHNSNTYNSRVDRSDRNHSQRRSSALETTKAMLDLL